MANYNLIYRGIEGIGGEIICHDREKNYIDGKLRNGYYFFINILNEHEVNVRINDFGGFNTTIAATAVTKLLTQMSK